MALSDYKNPEYIKAHARSYGAGEEELLNVAAIVQRFCIKAVVFYNWQEKGWPARGDKPLPSTPEPLGVYGRTESTYLTSRVKQVLSWTPFIDPSGKRASGWLDAVTWRDRLLRIWRTALGARAVYPNLTRWRLQQILQEDPRSDRTDNRGKVTRQEIRARYYRGIGLHVPAAEVTLYLDDHLKTIVEFEPNEPLEKIKIRGREYWQRPVHVDTDGRHWLTNAQLMERHGVSGHFVSYWARQQSRIRPGQKALRKKLIANELPGNRQQIDVYLDEDALDILAGKEAKRPGAGKGRTPTKLRLAMAELAKEAVCDLLADDRRLTTHHILELARRRGASRRATRKALRIYATYEDGPGKRRFWSLLPDASHEGNGHEANASQEDGFSGLTETEKAIVQAIRGRKLRPANPPAHSRLQTGWITRTIPTFAADYPSS